ncbi:hypothetical protein BH09BAC1_BH09BAC1_17220 [soil metagenome]
MRKVSMLLSICCLTLQITAQVSIDTSISTSSSGILYSEDLLLDGYHPMGREAYEYWTPTSSFPLTLLDKTTSSKGDFTANELASSTYKNGLLDGTFIGYWPNGNIQFEITVNEGKVQGISKQFYETGALFIKAQMMDTILNLPSIDSDGRKRYPSYITQSGEIVHSSSYQEQDFNFRMGVYDEETIGPPYHGYYRCYWPNGNLMEKSTYVNGGITGYSFYYKEDGTFDGFKYYDPKTYYSCIGYMQADGSVTMLKIPED